MNATKSTKVLPSLDEIFDRLRTRYHIASLGILGSYVRGKQRKTADLEASPKP